MALDGDLLLVGAPRYDPNGDGPGGNFGAAYVYRREGEAWVEEASLLTESVNSADFFGRSVALETGDDGTARVRSTLASAIICPVAA